ncbi:MAG: tetratricopeptide repeat protein [Planctomycetes bacterium]|nr:tetratricopeptide repeat protein [Planctomycetota bacterium]
MRRAVLIVTLLSVASSSAVAQEPIGAKEALRLVREKANQQEEAATEAEEGTSELAKAIALYKDELPNLTPDQATTRWLALFDLSRESVPDQDAYRMSDSESPWSNVLNVLPGPDSWATLGQQIEARELPEALPERLAANAMRLLGRRLNGQLDEFKLELKTIEASVAKPAAAKPTAPGADNPALEKLFQQFSNNASRQGSHKYSNVLDAIKGLRASLGGGDPIATFEESLTSVDATWGSEIRVPDLVGLVGRERASELLLKAFETKGVQLSFNVKRAATLALAREVALANVESLQLPPWGLCRSTDTKELFEALLKQFTNKQPEDRQSMRFRSNNDYGNAASFYFLGLILRGNDDTATQLFVEQATTNPDNAINLFGAWEKIRTSNDDRLKIYRFLLALAKDHPEFSVWDQLIATSTQLGRGDEVRRLIDELAQLPEPTRGRLRALRADVLLASGDIEAAIEQLRQNSTALAGKKDPESRNEMAIVAMKMVAIGRLMKRVEWNEEGFATIDKMYAAPIEEHPSGTLFADHYGRGMSLSDGYVQELVRRGRLDQAEAFLIDMIVAEKRQSEYMSYGGNTPGVLLAELYLNAGRHADVVTLLDEATWWSEDDLVESLSMEYTKSLAFIAAQAFAETGRVALARKLFERLVFENPGQDAIWTRLVDITGDDFPKIANRVFQRNQFEERPLIWLGTYQLKKGDVEAAETTIRQAISIDPSDGEQGKGDRMRVYAVLADILALKGDDQAEVFRGAVRAIRMAEDADDFLQAGMYSLAIELYNTSLEQFADAYCIQSRLAIQLAGHGDLEGAARHYQRAFELMPDSFGRVESHCFGCEGAFDGELASSIAERVFNRLAAERPNDPKVHYLLGYLRKSQSNEDEALKDFRKAVEFDPDYLNAWTKILELRQETTVPIELVDEAALNIYRLAPLASSYGISVDIRDLKQLWNAVAEVEQRIPRVESEPLYPLKAAVEARSTEQGAFGGGFGMSWSQDRGGNPQSPNEAISSNDSIGYITQILEASKE